MADARVRIFLAGRLVVEGPSVVVGEEAFPGRQGRLLFARLVLRPNEPIARDELAAELWPDQLPVAWETALRALVSKLRGVLARAGLDGTAEIVGSGGSYTLRLPESAWVDVSAAAEAIHRADIALRAGDAERAGPWALIARAIASRPLLPAHDSAWLDLQRRRLADLRLRSVETLAAIWLSRGDPASAARDAAEALEIDPFRRAPTGCSCAPTPPSATLPKRCGSTRTAGGYSPLSSRPRLRVKRRRWRSPSGARRRHRALRRAAEDGIAPGVARRSRGTGLGTGPGLGFVGAQEQGLSRPVRAR